MRHNATSCFTTLGFLFILSVLTLPGTADVVINELNYDPLDTGTEAGALREFVELYNPGPDTVDLSGYQFVNGITYTFPGRTTLAADAYLVLVRTPTSSIWRNKSYKILGPYEGKFSNGGERLELQRPGGTTVERLTYDDDFPWPRGADGYGPSMERIAWDLPADDFHSWRASLNDGGTPGQINSTDGTIPRPMILSHSLLPEHPTSSDEVTVRIELDAPYFIDTATLQCDNGSDVSTPAGLVNAAGRWRVWKGTTDPSTGLQWTARDYDDSAWGMAYGGFGYGDLDHVWTTLDDMRGSYSAYYIRQDFHVEALNALGSLSLQIYYDDGFIAYINGVEVARSNAPDSYNYQSVSTASHEATTLETFDLGDAANLLTIGENTIALVGFNTSLNNSTDFVLAPTLSASGMASGRSVSMAIVSRRDDSALFEGTIPAMASQTLVRYNVSLQLTNGETLVLPHVSEPHPFESYFVYDDDIPARLPILWLFDNKKTSLPGRSLNFSAAAVKPLGDEPVQVFDGVTVTPSRNGEKIKFLKGEELRGGRTINLSLESPQEGTTAGPQSPHVEHISYGLFRDFGALSLRCDWYRVIENNVHSQRIAVEQPNESFLEINHRDPEGNIYKIAYNEPGGYSKKTNLDEDDSDYRELFQYVSKNNRTNLEDSIHKYLNYEEVMGYDVCMFLLSHWDGIKNNMFLYHDPAPEGKWEVIPWDTDKTFGYTDSDPMYWKMPIDFYITLTAPDRNELNGRNLDGPITRPFHSIPAIQQDFVQRVNEAMDSGGLFSLERINGLIGEAETLLLADLDLAEQYTKKINNTRRNQITESSDTMRYFLTKRHEFLRGQLPATFTVARTVPTLDYRTGTTIVGIKITILIDRGETIDATTVERIPAGFAASNINATAGQVTLSGNTIVWTLSDASNKAILTYDLTAPDTNPPSIATLTGTATVGEIAYPIADAQLKYMPENTRSLGQDWVVGSGGNWIIADGVLTCYADTGYDPKHVWVDKDFGTGSYTVKADVRMVDWADGDLARSGIAVCVNPGDGERALNLLFHDDTGSVDELNDLVSWGTRSEYAWQTGQWYTMTLTLQGTTLTGTIQRTGSNEIPHTVEWDDQRNAQRAPGFPGLTGSTLQELSSQFDNFEVIINGKTVFADNFDDEIRVDHWAVY